MATPNVKTLTRFDYTGQTVAVVGRSGHLLEMDQGAEIDSADQVIRVNWTLPIDPAHYPMVGSRTDLLYTMQTGKWQQLHQNAARLKISACRVNDQLRELLAQQIDPKQGSSRYVPNSGTVAIVEALNAGASEVRAYGFTLHQDARYVDTGTKHRNLEGWQRKRERGMRTHNPEKDKLFLRRLLEEEPRFKPDVVLRGILMAEELSAEPADHLKQYIDHLREQTLLFEAHGCDAVAKTCALHAKELTALLERISG